MARLEASVFGRSVGLQGAGRSRLFDSNEHGHSTQIVYAERYMLYLSSAPLTDGSIDPLIVQYA